MTENVAVLRAKVLDICSTEPYIFAMRSDNERRKDLEDPTFRELRLLEEVDGSANLSQRKIAGQLGIALGVANLLVRSLAKKGYIKVNRLGWKRWAYVLTPAGIARKVNLTVAYVQRFIEHYRRVRYLLREEIQNLPLTSESRVALIGTSELAELAYLALRDMEVEDIYVYQINPTKPKFLGIKVNALANMDPEQFAKIVVAVRQDSEDVLERLSEAGASESQVVQLLQPGQIAQPEAEQKVAS